MDNKYTHDAVAFLISILPAILLLGFIVASIFEDNIRLHSKRRRK